MEKREFNKRNNVIKDDDDFDINIDEIFNDDFFSEEYLKMISEKVIFAGRCGRGFIESLTAWIAQKDSLSSQELKYFRVLVKYFKLDISTLDSVLNNEKKTLINSMLDDMANSGELTPQQAAKLLSSESFNKYYAKHSDEYTNSEIFDLMFHHKIDRISQREIEIIIESDSHEKSEKIVREYGLDESILDRKKYFDNIREVNQKVTKLSYTIEASGIEGLSEEDIQLLIENTSSGRFYYLASKVGFPQDIIERRRSLDKEIIDNSDIYSEENVRDAISGYYFKKVRMI